MKTDSVRQDVIAYCKANRQWKRELRLAHAWSQYNATTMPDARVFWWQVIEVNSPNGDLRIPLDN